MRILAIDTATRTASVALLDEEEILGEVLINVGLNHSVVLMPFIDTLLKTAGVLPGAIDLFACTIGPGSFTGLRIGAGVIKGMALASGKPVAGVSTLEALALNLANNGQSICPMLDAKKGQVYTALYGAVQGGLVEIRPECATAVGAFLKDIDISEQIIFTGDGAVVYAPDITSFMGDRARFATPVHQMIRASAVGLLGLRKYRGGDLLDAVSLTPRYLRPSGAETKKTADS